MIRTVRIKGLMWLGVCSCLTILPVLAGAMSCPPGTYVDVCVQNPLTTSATVTVTGCATQSTCGQIAGVPSFSYSQSITLNPGGLSSAEQCTTIYTGLVSGVFVHQISASSGQTQYQKMPVMNGFQSGTPNTRVHWQYFPNVVNVNVAGDGTGSTCPSNCTFRQALARASTLSSSTNLPVLVQFALTPPQTITMTSPAALAIAGNGIITIDGIDANGNPWIVGDATASQDPFQWTIDLAGASQFKITSSNNVLQGLYIKNTHASGTPQGANLLWFDRPGVGNLVKSLKIDGGNNCPSTCEVSRDLINLQYAGSGFGTTGHPGTPQVTVRNVEGFSSVDKGVKSAYGAWGVVKDSWFHNNYHGGLQATINGSLRDERNVVELQGRQNGSNTLIESDANGISSNGGTCLVETDANVSRMNSNNGIDVRSAGTPVLTAGNDYTCGNSQQGVAISSTPSLSGTGIGAVYNSGRGAFIDKSFTSGIVDFGGGALGSQGNNAFTQNESPCDFRNESDMAVNATNNQWTGGTASKCEKPGTIYTDPVQNHVTGSVTLDASNPAIPSDVFLAGQTIRIRGGGFNAIDANPAPDANCVTGNPNPPGVSCCLTRPKAVNVCAGTNTPNHDGSSCVELRDATGTYTGMQVTSVTPTTIVAQIPTTSHSQPCLGSDNEKVRVTKWDYVNGTIVENEGSYCTNYNEKDLERNPPS